MRITSDLLARLSSLDDLTELAAAMGFSPTPDDVSPNACRAMRLNRDRLGIRRFGVLARHGTFRVYGALQDDASRARVAELCGRLAAARPGERQLLLVLAADRSTLAAVVADADGVVCQFRIPAAGASAVACEVLSGLAPRPGESPLALSARTQQVLAAEGLTTRFFREFARLHERAALALVGVERASAAERRDLALVVLTRVLFLYFVQAKGWLAGRSDFLPSLLDTALRHGRPFHISVFEPLCFGALSAPVGARRGIARALGNVPFLNGGLFERHAIERRFPQARLPDHLWRELFDDLFERFHFTVRERDDTDAVDPEMLGRVFEGLMARDVRRQAGTYFTPRALLHEIVHQGLEAALRGRESAAVLHLRLLDPAVGSGAFLLEALTQLETRRAAVAPTESPAERRRAIVRDCLFGVDQDPMAVRLAELRLWLALVVEQEATWDQVAPLPNLDRNLRQGDSLLSPLDLRGAPAAGLRPLVRAVAERRAEYFASTGREKASLAHAIRRDEREIARRGVEAELASLQARLADAAAATGRDLFGQRHGRTPTAKRQVEAWRRRRRELVRMRQRIELEDAIPFFSYDVHFGDLLDAGGFDVVLGNPPWVRGERLPPALRATLSARYATFRVEGGSRFAHTPDLAVAFVERALELARPGGVVAFLLPAKLARAGYATRLRALLSTQTTIEVLDDRAHGPDAGFAATVFPLVLVVRKSPPVPGASVQVRIVTAGAGLLSGTALQPDLRLHRDEAGAPWLALPRAHVEALRASLGAGRPLASRFHPRLGVKTGANRIFLRPADRADELPPLHREPAVLGRDIAPFRVTPSGVVLAVLGRDGRPLRTADRQVLDFLAPHRRILERRSDARRAPLWSVFRTELLLGRWLVVWRDIAPRLEAAVIERPDGRGPVPMNSCYGVVAPDAYAAYWLSAFLNSAPARAVGAAVAERAAGGCYRFDARTVGAIPLPDPRDPHLRALAEIARAASADQPWDQDDLDRLAATALGLDATVARTVGALASAVR